jgi:hypothetical protein
MARSSRAYSARTPMTLPSASSGTVQTQCGSAPGAACTGASSIASVLTIDRLFTAVQPIGPRGSA